MANFFIITKTVRTDCDGHETLDRHVREFPSLEAASSQMLADHNAYKTYQIDKTVIGYAAGIPSYFKASGGWTVKFVHEEFLIKAEA